MSSSRGRILCANCNAQHDTRTSKKFTELLPMQYFNTTTGEYETTEIMEAICEVFKINWTCENLAEVMSKQDLELCSECSSILVQLYRFYTSFAALTIKTKSYLSTLIHFQKDLSSIGLPILDSSAQNKNYTDADSEEDFHCNSPDFGDDFESNKEDNHDTSDVQIDTEQPNDTTKEKSVPPKKRGSRKINVESSPKTDIVPNKKDCNSKSLTVILRRLTPSRFNKTTTVTKIGDDVSKLQCQECNKVFKFPIQLRIHFNSVSHKEKIKEGETKKNQRPEDIKKNSVKCKKAAKKVNQKYSKQPVLVRQKRKYTKRREKTDLPLKKRVDEKNKICTVCQKGFTRRTHLQRHMLKHEPKKKRATLECERCGKMLSTEGGLRRHHAAHTRDDNKHICKDCGKKFHKLEALEHHEKVDHGGYKPHECPQCGKCFRLKDKLKLHVLSIHERKNPYPCSKCEKTFRSKYHLNIHDVAVHIKGTDSAFGCSECKRKFSDREALEKHVLVHQQEKPYICEKCGKGFQTSPRLKLHEKSHQEMPSCVCHICGRAYKHIRDLKLHEVSHQDESTFRFGCGDCEKKFYRIDLLRAHQSNEKHFSDDIIGPSPALREKEMGSKGSSNFYDLPNKGVESGDDEDEFENNCEPVLPTPKVKKRQVSKPKQKIQKTETIGTGYENLNNLPQHTSTTVIYPPPNLIPINFEEHSSRRETTQFIQRSEANTNFAFNHRERMQPHHSIHSQPQHPNHTHSHCIPNPAHQLQVQTLPAHPPSQFGNSYMIREIGSDRSGSGNLPPNEQIGFDVLSSFINNLG